MKIIPFKECNSRVPHLGNAPCMMIEDGSEGGKLKAFVFAYQPNEEDKKAIAAGNPIFFQIYKELPPFMLYTIGADGKLNLER